MTYPLGSNVDNYMARPPRKGEIFGVEKEFLDALTEPITEDVKDLVGEEKWEEILIRGMKGF